MTVTHGGGVMSHVEEALLPPSAGFFDALGQKAPYCHCCVAIRFMWRSVAAVSMCTHTHTHTHTHTFPSSSVKYKCIQSDVFSVLHAVSLRCHRLSVCVCVCVCVWAVTQGMACLSR